MNKYRLYLLNIVLIVCSYLYVIPDLSKDDRHFETDSGTLYKTYIETYKYKPSKSFVKVDKERLILVTVDRLKKQYIIGEEYREYWSKFLDSSSIGKQIEVYTTSRNPKKPIKIELNGELIYDLDIHFNWGLLVIIITIGLTGFNIYQYYKEE